jgi:hypothetical protein
MSSSRRATALALAALLLLALAGYGRLLRPGQVPYSAHSDLVSIHLGTKTVLYDSVHGGGGVPFWRDDQMAGVPAFTNPESQYLYPLHFLFYLVPPADAVGWAIWLQLVAGALALFWVGRTLGLGRWACLIMAVAQLFSFKLIAITYAGFLPILPIATLFPLLFASLFRLIEEPDLEGALLLGASGALCLSTGGFQLIYDAAIFLGGYAAWRIAGLWRDGLRRQAGRFASAFLGAGLLAGGVMACQLIPLLSESALLSRRVGSYEFFLSGYTFTARHWLNFLYPESFGSLFDASRLDRYLWEDVAYFGLVPLILAIVGAVRGWRRPHVLFLVLGFAASLLLAARSPLNRALFELLPGFALFRMPLRFVYLTGFFGIALAGIGAEELWRALAGGRPRDGGATRARGGAWPALAVPTALVLLIGTEGVFYARRYVDTKPASFVLPRPAYADLLHRDASVFRIAPRFRDTVQPGWAAPLGLQVLSGALPFNLDHYRSLFEMMQTGKVAPASTYAWLDFRNVARSDLLDALNVKYIVSPAPLANTLPPGYQEVASLARQPVFSFFRGMSERDLFVYRNERFLERARWAGQVVTVRDRQEMIAMMETYDLRTTSVVLDPAGPSRSPVSFSGDAADRVTITASRGGRLDLETRARGRRFLAISEVWHPGWRASIDGRPLPLQTCNLALMGAWVPPGDHTIVLQFRPLHWPLSVGITCASLALFLALFAGARRARALRHQGGVSRSSPPPGRGSSGGPGPPAERAP